MGDFFSGLISILFRLLWPFILIWALYVGFLIYRNLRMSIWVEKLQQMISNSRNFVRDWKTISETYWEEAKNSHSWLTSPIVAAYRHVMTDQFLSRGLVPPAELVDLPSLPFRLREYERALFWCKAKTVVMKQYGTRVVNIKAGKNIVVATTWGLHFMDGIQVRSIPRKGFDLLQYGGSCLDVQGNRPGSTRYSLRCDFGFEQVLFQALTCKLKHNG